MSDDASKPPERPTTQIPKVEIIEGLLRDIQRTTKEGFAHQDDRMSKVEASVDLLVDEGRATNKRLTAIELWKDDVAERLKSNSTRVKAESKQNLEQDAMLARLASQLEELANRPDTAALVLAEIKTAAKTPLGQKLAAAAGTLALAVMGYIGVRLERAVVKLEEKPPTVQVQPAPTVYVTTPADGGAR